MLACSVMAQLVISVFGPEPVTNKAPSPLPVGHHAMWKIYLTNESHDTVQRVFSITLIPIFIHSIFLTETEINQWLEVKKAFPLS